MKLKNTPLLRAGMTLLACLAGLSAAQADTTNLLSLTTFEPDAAAGWGYGYYYGNNGFGSYQYIRNYTFPDDVEMTNAVFAYTFDNTDLAGNTGYGTGSGGPFYRTDPDPAAFVSTNRVDYLLSWDAKAEGLLPTSAAGNFEMQLQLFNSEYMGRSDHKILQVNIPYSAGSNWTHFSYTLEDGNLADSTEADFSIWHTNITGVQFNVNSHLPNNAFGFDADNWWYLDNLKLQVIVKPLSTNVPPPTYGVAVADWNMDDKPVWYEYHYDWSQNDVHAAFNGGNNANNGSANTLGVGGSSAWYLTMDNSAFLNANPVPSWAGGGTGGGGPVNFALFDTDDLGGYQVSFDARVEGLMTDKADTTSTLQLHMDAPDNTIMPGDSDTNADFIVRLDFPVSKVSSNWQTYTYFLNKGTVGGGNKTNFTAYFSKITGFRTQWQIENATSLNDWDYDANNQLIIDNFKLNRVYVGLGPINVSSAGNELTLTWGQPSSGSVKLQSAATANGPYTDVANATSPYKTPIQSGNKFFRTIWVP